MDKYFVTKILNNKYLQYVLLEKCKLNYIIFAIFLQVNKYNKGFTPKSSSYK